MTQVASLMTAVASAMPDSRPASAEAGAASEEMPGEGRFARIFKGLAAGPSEVDSAQPANSREPGEKPAAARAKGGGVPAGAGLHRLLASGRFQAASKSLAGESDTADETQGSLDLPASADEAVPSPGGKKAGAKSAAAEPAAPTPSVPSQIPAGMVPAVPVAGSPQIPGGEKGAEPKPEGKAARGVVVVTPEADDGAPATPVRVPVTVESIETHFAPLETVNAAVAEAAASGSLKPVAAAGTPAPAARGVVPPRSASVSASAAADPAMPGAEAASGDVAVTAVRALGRADTGPIAGASRDQTHDGGAAEGGQPALTKAEAAAGTSGAVAALPAATLNQIGDTIVGAAAGMTQASDAPAARQPSGGEASRAMVKVLNVRLDPPEYGSLAVRLTLQDGALSVQIRAERETTAAALDKDRQKLAEQLKASGYGTDAAMIDTRRDMAVMRNDATAGGGNGGTGSGNAGSGSAGGMPGQGTGSGAMARREDGSGGGQSSARERPEGRDGATGPDTGPGNLYV